MLYLNQPLYIFWYIWVYWDDGTAFESAKIPEISDWVGVSLLRMFNIVNQHWQGYTPAWMGIPISGLLALKGTSRSQEAQMCRKSVTSCFK